MPVAHEQRAARTRVRVVHAWAATPGAPVRLCATPPPHHGPSLLYRGEPNKRGAPSTIVLVRLCRTHAARPHRAGRRQCASDDEAKMGASELRSASAVR